MLSLLVQVEKNNGEDCMDRVIDNLKKELESSAELSECITTVKNKYPIPTGKFITLIVLSFVQNIILGFTFYGTDFGTDVDFGNTMQGYYHLSINDTGLENIECKQKFGQDVSELYQFCQIANPENIYPCQNNMEMALHTLLL